VSEGKCRDGEPFPPLPSMHASVLLWEMGAGRGTETDPGHVVLALIIVSACLLGVGLIAVAAKRLLERVLNALLAWALRRFAAGLLSGSMNVRLGFNYIDICNVDLSPTLMSIVNKLCHDSCQFVVFKIGSVHVQLVPYILVEVRDLAVQMNALPPDEWSVDNVMNAMKASRSELFDMLTETIQWKRKNKKWKAVVAPTQAAILSLVDFVLASARLNMYNVQVGYRLNRSLDIESSCIVASIGMLVVSPVSFSFDYFFSAGMTMNYEIHSVSAFCQSLTDNIAGVEAQMPLLEPAFVSGTIRLPKIISQMIRPDPLESKYGYLVVNATDLVVNGNLENLIGVSDFSVMMDTYRKWYSCVEKTFTESRETEGDVMFTYITAYLKYISETSSHKKSELQKLYHSLEERLCDDDIRLSRSLVLGWYATDVLLLKKFKEDKNFKLFETFKSNDSKMVEYKTLLKKKFENELLSSKELRKMKVDIYAKSILIHLPCFDGSKNAPGRSSTASQNVRRTTVWLENTNMHVTEPIVKMSEVFDEPRILSGTVKRFVIANTNYSGNGPVAARVTPRSVTAGMPLLDSLELTTAERKSPAYAKNLTSASLLDGGESATEPNMVSFHVVENVWSHEVTVTAELSSAVLVPHVGHALDLAEYAVLAVEDIASVHSYYVTGSQLPSAVSALPALPSSLMHV
jgi:hypothetical protein